MTTFVVVAGCSTDWAGGDGVIVFVGSCIFDVMSSASVEGL